MGAFEKLQSHVRVLIVIVRTKESTVTNIVRAIRITEITTAFFKTKKTYNPTNVNKNNPNIVAQRGCFEEPQTLIPKP